MNCSNFARACSYNASRMGRATFISAIVITATLMSGGFAPATASNLLSPRDSPGSTKVPSVWVVNGSGSATYNWHIDEPGACNSGSGKVSWTANQVGATFFPSPTGLGVWDWAFQINADIDGQEVTSGALLTWPGVESVLMPAGPSLIMAAISANCRRTANNYGLSAITDAMMGKVKQAPQSSKMQCKRKKPPTTTLPNTPKPKWVCTISTGASLVFRGGESRTTSSFGGYSGHWKITITRGHAKKPPTLPKPIATKTSLDVGFNGPVGNLATPPVCIILPGTLMVNFSGFVQGRPVVLQIHLIGKTGRGTYTIAPQTVASALFISATSGGLSGTGKVTIAADGHSGSVNLAFKEATGTETISGRFGCANT